MRSTTPGPVGFRLREAMFLVLLVALALGWWRDRATLNERLRRSTNALNRTQELLDASRAWSRSLTNAVAREASRLKEVEAALADCEASRNPPDTLGPLGPIPEPTECRGDSP